MLLLGYRKFRVYRLSHSRYPVTLFTSAKRLARSVPSYGYCIHSHGAAPKDDDLLSMKLLIDHDEPLFIFLACRFSSPGSSAGLPTVAPDLTTREPVPPAARP